MTRYSDYDPFAWVYNKHWGNFSRRIFPVLDELILKNIPARAHILDLCCGTGQLAKELIARGYQVTGIDGSKEMMKIARDKAPKVRFILDDARSFRLPAVYSAVFSTFDSLNHVMSLKELGVVFRNVFACLEKGGLFLFDLNTEAGYKSKWHGFVGAIIEEDHICVHRDNYLPEERKAEFEATMFRLRDGQWWRTDFTLLQRCYSEAEVRSMLDIAGFGDTHVYAYYKKRGLHPQTKKTPRIFFVCQKPE
jgi:SAM-dependent methyltransferase